MSTSASIPRIILGPNERGRDYDLLAISEGLNASGYVPLLRRFISDISTFVTPNWPVHAFFPLGDPAHDPWYLSTTTHNTAVPGIPMRITAGLVLDIATLESLDWRVAPLLEPWRGPPPPRGVLVEPLRLAGALPPPAKAEKLERTTAILLGSEDVAVVLDDGDDPGPTLTAVHDALQGVRPEISFITMPPVRPANIDFALAIYPASVAARLRDPVRSRVVTSDNLPEVSGPTRTWHGFVEAVERADPKVSSRLTHYARQIAASPAAYGDRIVATLRQENFSDVGRRAAFEVMLKAAGGMIDVGAMARSHLFVGLMTGLQSCIEASHDKRGWFLDYGRWRNEIDLTALDPTVGALAAGSTEILEREDVAAAIGPLAFRHASAATSRAVLRSTPGPDCAYVLLLSVCSVLEQRVNDEALWDAGAHLFEALGRGSTDASSSWIQLTVAMGRWPELLRASDPAGQVVIGYNEAWTELGHGVVASGHEALDQAEAAQDEAARGRWGLIALGAHLLAQVHSAPLG